MSEQKYIVMQVPISETMAREDIICFPKDLVHKTIAEYMEHMYAMTTDKQAKVISAGFVNMNVLSCYGESESLNIKSRPENDSKLLISGSYGFNIVDIEKE